MTTFALVLILLLELVFCIVSRARKSSRLDYAKGRLALNVTELAVFCALMLAGVTDLGIRFFLLFCVLALRVAVSALAFALRHRRAPRPLSTGAAVAKWVGNALVLLVAFLPALLFTNYQGLPTTGAYDVATVSEIYVDPTRLEDFEQDGSHREVPVQFWYPQDAAGQKFPVVFFSHGAFGFRESNESLFRELASHGYVVCSMDHPYHSLFTEDTDGKMITVDPGFMQDVMAEQGSSEQFDAAAFAREQAWIELREADMNLVVDTVKERCGQEGGVYALIDPSKIGLVGHSMGGAAAVALGRSRTDVSAVVDLDGTMLSERLSWDGEKYVVSAEPYPVPLLEIDNEEHHAEVAREGSSYVNRQVLAGALDGRETYFKGSGHMNFTDLPLFSPVLADALGTGSIDAESCITQTNQIVLSFFDQHLKGEAAPQIADSYE